MRLFCLCLLLLCLDCCLAKGSLQRALADSTGQETIEITGPSKDLPADMEEEPAAEDPEELQQGQPSSPTPASPATTRRDSARKALPEDDNLLQRKGKEAGLQSTADEEARIEKELAEIYKDTDYKSADESGEAADNSERGGNASAAGAAAGKEALRSAGQRRGSSFKFQPNLNNPKEVERFRTSVDEISCEKGATPRTLKADGGVGASGSLRNACNVLLTTALMASLASLLSQ